MNSEKKVSEMIIAVSGDLFQVVNSRNEMQAHLDLATTAWNIGTESIARRKVKLKSFLQKQKKYAPSNEALQGLEWEMRRIIKQKDKLYPDVSKKIVKAEAVETSKDNYIIRAYFKDEVFDT